MPAKKIHELIVKTRKLVGADRFHAEMDISSSLTGYEDPKVTVDDISEAIGIKYASDFTYALHGQVFYDGIPYRSLSAGNIGNQPDISPAFWEVTGGGGSGGGVNFAKNTLTKANLAGITKGSGSFVTTPTWDTTVNIYAGGALLIPFTAGAKTANDYVDFDLTEIMQAYVNQTWKLKFNVFIDTGATFVSDDLIIEYFDGAIAVPVNVIQILLNNHMLQEFSMLPTNTLGVNCKLRIRAKTGSTTCVGNIRIANLSISPSPIISSQAKSGWMAYPQSLVPIGLGVCTILQSIYSRDGEDVLIDIKLTAGTPDGSEMRVPLPNGLVSKSDIPTIKLAGIVAKSSVSAISMYALIEPGKTYLTFGVQGSGSASLSKVLGNAWIPPGETISIQAHVTVSQFSSNLVLLGQNEPMYLSNSESAINTNGAVGKTYNGIEGSLLIAHTSATYDDITLSRAILPNESFEFQLRSKVDGAWISKSFTFTGQGSVIVTSYPFTVGGVQYGANIIKTSSGQLRVRFGQYAATDSGVSNTTWSQMIAAADGYDRWRVRIGQASVSEQAPVVYAEARVSADKTVSTTQPCNYDTIIRDTHGCITPSPTAWKFTCPYSGPYDLCGWWSTNSSFEDMTVYRTPVSTGVAAPALILARNQYAGSGKESLSGKIWLEKGDILDFRTGSGSSTWDYTSVLSANRIQISLTK